MTRVDCHKKEFNSTLLLVMNILFCIFIISPFTSFQHIVLCLSADEENSDAISQSFEERVNEELEKDKEIPESHVNSHFKIPNSFKDFGRRFVLQYPYSEIKEPVENIKDELSLDKIVKEHLENAVYEKFITPVKASPEVVLAVAKQSAMLQAAMPINPSDDVIQRNILRTGDYWNDVIEDPVDPDLLLRSRRPTKINSLNLRFQPGSDLYELVSKLKKISPRLLYVINDDSE